LKHVTVLAMTAGTSDYSMRPNVCGHNTTGTEQNGAFGGLKG
jgi:hypothetical protein